MAHGSIFLFHLDLVDLLFLIHDVGLAPVEEFSSFFCVFDDLLFDLCFLGLELFFHHFHLSQQPQSGDSHFLFGISSDGLFVFLSGDHFIFRSTTLAFFILGGIVS